MALVPILIPSPDHEQIMNFHQSRKIADKQRNIDRTDQLAIPLRCVLKLGINPHLTCRRLKAQFADRS